MPAIVKAQTTKQAKAAYKARGRPALSDKELRQLQRSIELEERAERAREAEKRRTEAAKKRAEREQKEGLTRENARLGSQRRTDRFGFVASQFHLGKFFGQPRGQNEVAKAGDAASAGHRVEADLEDEFGSDDLDDDTMLEALDSPQAATKLVPDHDVAKRSTGVSIPPPRPNVQLSSPTGVALPTARPSAAVVPPPPRLCLSKAPGAASRPSVVSMSPSCRTAMVECAQTANKDAFKPAAASESPSMLMPPPTRPSVGVVKAVPVFNPLVQEDLDSFWDELDSNTQVARELGGAGSSLFGSKSGGAVDEKRADSFCSGDFDMTEEELDELDSAIPAPLPAFQAEKSMLLPPIPTKAVQKVQTRATSTPQTTLVTPQSAIKGPFLPASSLYCSADLGFTSTQLESFIDDDIQLSQAVPG